MVKEPIMSTVSNTLHLNRYESQTIGSEELDIGFSESLPSEECKKVSGHTRRESVLYYKKLATKAQQDYRSGYEASENVEGESRFEAVYRKLSKIEIKETQRYQFAILIDRGSSPSYFRYGCRWQYEKEKLKENKLEAKNNLITIAEKLIQDAGAELDLLYDTDEDSEQEYYILLVHFPDEKLKEANIEMTYHRWLEDPNASLHLRTASNHKLTYAEKIQNAEMIITRRLNLRKGKLGINSILPLHCYDFQRKFMNQMLKKLNFFQITKAYITVSCRNVCRTVKKGCSYFYTQVCSREHIRDEEHGEIDNVPLIVDVSELNKEETYLIHSDFFVYEIRRHYGEQVALYFAYIINYTRFLIYPTVLGIFIAIGNIFWDEETQNKILIMGGMIICSIWAPLWAKVWVRKKNELIEIWGQSDSKLMYLNPSYDPKQGICGGWCRLCGYCGGTRSEEDVKKEERLNASEQECRRCWRNLPISILIFVMTLIIILAMLFCTSLLVEIYIQLKNVPSCSEVNGEEQFVNLFGTHQRLCFTGLQRWFAILLQGIVLGLVVDILQLNLLRMLAYSFTTLQNYKYQEEFDDSLIFKIFCFDWLSLYFWYFAICFLYVPFGKEFSIFLQNHGLNNWSFNYEENSLDLRDVFITPLIATQFLNFLVDTFGPYLIARIYYNRRKSSSQKKSHHNSNSVAKKRAIDLACKLSRKCDAKINAVNQCGKNQQTYFDILVESEQSEYSTHRSYNDMILQYGYVVMFSVVWPWIPFCAIMNNLLDLRGNAFTLFYNHRRPLPRKASSIGLWGKIIRFMNYFSILINVCLICVSTGEIEWFFKDCHKIYLRMSPDFNCGVTWTYRFAFAALLEHAGLAISLIILIFVEDYPVWLRNKMTKAKKKNIQLGQKYYDPPRIS